MKELFVLPFQERLSLSINTFNLTTSQSSVFLWFLLPPSVWSP